MCRQIIIVPRCTESNVLACDLLAEIVNGRLPGVQVIRERCTTFIVSNVDTGANIIGAICDLYTIPNVRAMLAPCDSSN